MVRIRVDLGAMEAWPTNRLPGFAEGLLAALPGLADHACSLRRPGGFLERMAHGTWIGHVVEHVALALQAAAGVPVRLGKTRSVRRRPGVYDVLYAYQEPAVALLAGRFALQLVEGLLPPELRGFEGLERLSPEPPLEPCDAVAAIERLRALDRRVGLGPSTGSIVAAARRRGIPVMRLDEQSYLQLGWGARQQRIRASITSRTPFLAVDHASDKSRTKQLLLDAGAPAPRGVVVRTAEAAVAAAAELGGLVAVKPLNGNHGRGVATRLQAPDEIRSAFAAAAAVRPRVLVEQHLEGRDYRVLVVGGEVVAVAERRPAQVVGDGVSTVIELVEALNRDPRRGVGHEKPLTRIRMDARVQARLAQAGLSPESVPSPGIAVILKDSANLSTGGTAVDRTDEIHPENAALCRRAARTLGLDVAGLDVVCPDIGRSVRDTGGGIVEINAAPGLRMHLEPSEGQPRAAGEAIARTLFPIGAPSRIPTFAVTGTNGKSTTARMLAHILQRDGRTVGLTTTTGVYVNAEAIYLGDASGPRSGRMVFRDPLVDTAVFEVARGGLLREGLAFDRCDVGCVTNVQPDHLGLKDIQTVQDLARVKAVVVENVARRGVSVLNADDVLTARMRRHAGGRIAFFSLRGGPDMPAFLRNHIQAGGLAVVREDGRRLVAHRDGRRIELVCVTQIPATLGGLAAFNVQNAMAAAAMALGGDVDPAVVRAGLASFGEDFTQNPGRLSVYDRHPFKVIVDYAHNPAGLLALREVLTGLRGAHARQIGMVSIPGDRRDEDMLAMGEIAARTFDDIVLREDPGRRGRRRGEIIELLAQGALRAGFDPRRLHRARNEAAAADQCLRMARAGDLVVLLPTEVDAVWRQVSTFIPPERPEAAPSAGQTPTTVWAPPAIPPPPPVAGDAPHA
jgi:cyanophycin synthetase